MEFRNYQNQAKAFLENQKRGILALPMGTGKTPVAMAASETFQLQQELIIAPANAIGTWKRHIASMTGNRLPVNVVWGSPGERDAKWRAAIRGTPGFYISTYDTYWRDLKNGMAPLRWPLTIFDEAHRMRNRKTNRYKQLHRIQSGFKFFLTGTSASRGPQDLWTMMNMCDPVRFSSYWRWVNEFCQVIETPFGREITGVRNKQRLDALLLKYLFYRRKEDILPELPPKTRTSIPVQMTPKQSRLYQEIKKDMLAELSDNRILMITLPITKILRLRQLLTSPKLLDPNFPEYGGAIEAFLDRVEDMDEPHCVLFSPFAAVLPIIGQCLEERGYKYLILRGGLSPLEVEQLEDRFRKERCIALCSISFAESYSLSSACEGYFIGYDYDPEKNKQAEDRLHRFDSVNACNFWYMQHEHTVDEQVLDIINSKDRTTSEMFKRFTGAMLLKLLNEQDPACCS